MLCGSYPILSCYSCRGGFGSSGGASNAYENRERSRSRSPNRNSDWADNSKQSSQETMMEVAQPPVDNQSSPNHNPDTVDCKSNEDPQNHSQKSPICTDVQGDASGNGQADHKHNSNFKEDDASVEPPREDQP